MTDPPMPLQNRVTPEGLIVRSPERGTMMGNRGGQLHDGNKELGRRRWVSRQWICCVLDFNGRKREVMAPNRYTELFFLDEATALSAGHRPCFECRRKDALRFASLWAKARGKDGRATAGEMDDVLHRERLDARGDKPVWQSEASTLPMGAMIRYRDAPHLVTHSGPILWTPAGYVKPDPQRPKASIGVVDVLTPSSIVAVIAAGYLPKLHPSSDVTRS